MIAIEENGSRLEGEFEHGQAFGYAVKYRSDNKIIKAVYFESQMLGLAKVQ